MSSAIEFRRPNSRIAFVSLVATLGMSVSHRAMAACNGSIASPNSAAVTVLCNNSPTPPGDLTVNDNTTYVDTTTTSTAGNNTLLQFDGHGRTLINNGSIINDRVILGTSGGRGRTAITMGAGTVNAGNGTSYLAPVYNSSTDTTTITVSGSTPSSAWVGQSIVFGRYDAADSDFFPAQSFVIIAVSGSTVTIAGQLPPDYSGTGSLPERYAIVSNYGQGQTIDGVFYNNVIKNNGTISTQITASEINANATGTAPNKTSVSNTATARAITTSVAGSYLIDNSAGASITVKHDGLGNAYAIEEGGNVTLLTVKNAGTIEAERTGTVTITSLTSAGVAQGKKSNLDSSIGAATLGSVNAVNTQEEADTFILYNLASGVVRAKGDYSAALQLRPGESIIINDGLIEHLSSSGDYSKGFAIGQASNPGEIRELTVVNNGTIHGDILAVNSNSLRWYLLSTELGLDPNGLNDRLTINSQHGQTDSEIVNTGTIVGNFWYSNGEHELQNSGTITGNIDVEQRDTTVTTGGGPGSATVATVFKDEDGNATNNTLLGTSSNGLYTYRGTKTFEFENTGTFTGNLNITNGSSTISNATFGSETINKTIASNNMIENSGLFDGNITIKDVTGAKNTIILSGDGFGRMADGSINTSTGNITAVNGTGENILILEGDGTLRGNVSKFTTLRMSAAEDTTIVDDDDTPAGGPNWTLAAGKLFEFLSSAEIDGGVLNVLGTLKTPITNIGEAGTLKGTGTVQGDISNNGTIDVEDTTLHVIGNVSLNDGSKLATTISETGNGKLDITGHLTSSDEASIVARLDGMQVFTGDTFTVATAAGGFTGLPEVDQTVLLHWFATTSGNDLNITADIVDAGDIEGVSRPGAAAVNALLGFESDLGIAMLNLDDEADVAKAANQLAPETNFATQQAAITLNNAIGQHIDTRLAAVGGTGGYGQYTQPSGLGMQPPSGLGMRQSDPNRSNLGGSLKDDPDFVAPRSAALWGQAFGAGMDQDEHDLVDGYNARLYGILAGYDNWISPGVRLGIAAGYANTNIDGKGDTRQNSTSIDSYLIEAYGSVKGAGWYMTGRTGFTWHDYDTVRVLTVPVSDRAKGSHDGRQFNAAVEIGAPLRQSGSIITPVASLTYSNLEQDAYTETSDGGMALSVESQSNVSLVSALGLKALVPIANDTVLEGRAMWLHEFADSAQVVTASFAAGGGTFSAAGPDVGRDSAGLGIGLLGEINASTTFELNYDANIRPDFLAHIGSARLHVKF